MILGDQYTLVLVSSNGKCILGLRILHATFKELGNRFPHMIKSRAGCNDDSGENLSPGLMIVSLPGQLVNLGIEGYIQEFLVFKHCIEVQLKDKQFKFKNKDEQVGFNCRPNPTPQVVEGLFLYPNSLIFLSFLPFLLSFSSL